MYSPRRMLTPLLVLWLTPFQVAPPAPADPEKVRAPAAGPTIVVEFVAETVRGQPVVDLRLEEIDVVQDATRQPVRTLIPLKKPGHYEVRYVPLSGKPGGVTLSIRRPNTKVRGPEGAFLTPRVIPALSRLERELDAVLDTDPTADALPVQATLLRFEPTAEGVRHAVAVELPLATLAIESTASGARFRLQGLARVKREGDEAAQHISFERVFELGSGVSALQRVVWTGSTLLRPGAHAVDVVVRDPVTGKASVRRLHLDVPAAGDRLRLSSVVLLRPRNFFFVRDASPDDPLVFQGEPQMPTLQASFQQGPRLEVRFFVAVYPGRREAAPLALRAEVLREGLRIAEVPLRLPPAEPSGEVRYVGRLATGSLRPGSYTLRLRAQQGDDDVAEEVSFNLVSGGD